MTKIPPAGLYAPLPVFFTKDDELGTSPACVSSRERTNILSYPDLDAYAKHAKCKSR